MISQIDKGLSTGFSEVDSFASGDEDTFECSDPVFSHEVPIRPLPREVELASLVAKVNGVVSLGKFRLLVR